MLRAMSSHAMRKEPFEGALRALYSLALYLLSPLALYHLVARGFRVREYFRRWDERYASYGTQRGRPCVWLHAVSVGEVNAAAPLVNALLKQRPDIRWVITTITPTGSDRVRALWGERVDHVYLPYDLPGSATRFLRHFQPSLALIMETELWPNMLFGCRDQGIPVYILNARLSARSLRGYRVLGPLIRRALRSVHLVAAQSEDDGKRFIRLGAHADRVVVTGNLNARTDNGAVMTYSLAQAPANGSVALGQDGSYTYTPDSNLAISGGTDTFRVTIDNGSAYRLTGFAGTIQSIYSSLAQRLGLRQPDTITVAVPVTIMGSVLPPTNRAPVFGTPAVGTPDPVSGIVIGSVTASDADGDPLTYGGSTTTTKGTVVVNAANGGFTYTPTAAAREAAAKPGADAATKADNFTVTVSDDRGGTATTTVTVTVSPASISPTNSAPVFGSPVVGTPNPVSGIVIGSVTASDADGDPLTYSGSTTTSKGTVVVDAANGGFTYTPTAAARHAAAKPGADAATKADNFAITVSDGRGGTATTLVNVAVSPTNAAPVAGAVTTGAPDGSTGKVAGTLTATDADGDSLTYSGSTTTSKGTAVVNADGGFTYTPTAEARRAAYLLGAPIADLSDTFAVTVVDGYGGSTSVPVTVAIDPAVTFFLAGDVKRDPATGRIALRTWFPESQPDPVTGNPGYLNWIIATQSAGAKIAFPSDVSSWDNFFLVGTALPSNTYNGAADLPQDSVLRNPLNGAVALRTMFPEPDYADYAWLVLTTGQGAHSVTRSSVQGWDILYVPGV